MTDEVKTALLIGATGLVGGALLSKLVDDNRFERVIAISRRPLGKCPEKVKNVVIDFDRLDEQAELFDVDCVFSCLGTTRKQAGSLAAQRVVDYDYQLQAARLARHRGAKHFLLVSSSGARSESRSGYLKMKGEVEAAVKDLNFDILTILQPSLLVGARERSRFGEGLGEIFLNAVNSLGLLKAYQPISGDQVARALMKSACVQKEKLKTLRLDNIFSWIKEEK